MLMRCAGAMLFLAGLAGQAAAQPAVLGNRLGEYRQAPGGFSSRLGSAERPPQDTGVTASRRSQPDATPGGRSQPRPAGDR